MNADGTAQRRLTRNDTYEGQPIWAPNGRVVFESAPDSEIFVRRGTRAIQLTDNDASDGAVAWSPNGSRMAYSSGQGGRHAVYLMRRDGAGQRELTRTTSQVQTLEWSPSGDRLLAVTGGGALLVDTSSGGARLLARNADAVTWNPNGREIAYIVEKTLFVVGEDGQGQRRVSTIAGFNGEPDGWPSVDWSSRGQIAFTVEGRSDLALRIVSASGTVLHDLSGTQPSWSPDGRSLAYVSGDVWVLRSRDGKRRQLNLGRYASSPAWARDGRSLVVRREDGIWKVPLDGGERVLLVRAAQVGVLDVR